MCLGNTHTLSAIDNNRTRTQHRFFCVIFWVLDVAVILSLHLRRKNDISSFLSLEAIVYSLHAHLRDLKGRNTGVCAFDCRQWHLMYVCISNTCIYAYTFYV